MSAWPLLFGTLIGTGSGSNILPMGAATNVFACGLLEKNSCLVSTKRIHQNRLAPLSGGSRNSQHIAMVVLGAINKIKRGD